jgi:Methylamine utilisation protein MauE
MTWVPTLARFLLAGMFLVSGPAKLFKPRQTQAFLEALKWPKRPSAAVAITLPLVELALAATLLPLETARWAAAVAVGLLVAFSGVLVAAMRQGTTAGCPCLGGSHRAPPSLRALARNSVLLGLAAVGVWPGERASTLATQLAPGISPVTVIFAALLLAALIEAWAVKQLVGQNRRLLRKVSALEQLGSPTEVPVRSARRPYPLALGAPAPAFDLPDASGAQRSLSELLALSPRGLNLVFLDPGCPGCGQALERVAAISPGQPGPNTVVFCRRANDVMAVAASSPVGLTVIECTPAVAASYGVTVVPSALFVSPEGVIASSLAVGENATLELLDTPRLVDYVGAAV